jgi:hypothetical protein
MNLTHTNWPKGWRPDFDAVNGDPSGLVRMDNLTLDSTGVISLIEGMTQLGQNYIDFVSDLFSLNIGGTEYIWVATGNGSSVSRTTMPNLIPGQVNMAVNGAGTPSARACFGACLGQTLAFAGQMRTKDPISSAPLPLGLLTPGGVFGTSGTATALNQSTLLVTGGTPIIQEGTDAGSSDSSILINVDPTSLEGVGVLALGTFDTTSIGGLQSSDLSTDLFQFTFSLNFPNPSAVNVLQIQVLLDPNPSDPTGYQNYYTFNVDTSPGGALNFSLLSGPDVASVITIARGAFTRVGGNSTLDWTTVTGIRVTCQCTATANFYFYNPGFIGGSTGQLNGVYNYVQVNARDNGSYVALSPVSLPFYVKNAGSPTTNNTNVTVINGSVQLHPAATIDSQVTESWYFRIAASNVGLDSTGNSLNASSLDQYYFCGKANGTFQDTLSDNEIIEIGITLNSFLQTLRATDKNGITDNIFGCEGLIFGRMLYMGQSFIYLSDFLNPDAIDSRYTLKPSGDSNEKNLFIRKIANGSLILATTRDLYEVTGTFNPLPNGTIDVTLIPIGDAYPPLSQDHVQTQGGVFYIASDGIRFTTGQHSQNVSPLLQYLFQGQTRHNVPPFLIQGGNAARYPITAGHNRIYTSIPCTDGTRRLIVYDVNASLFYLRYTDPICLYVTPNGEVLAGYYIAFTPGATQGSIFQLESGRGITSATGNEGYPITFTTVFDANGQPRNRKDTFTLKLILDTGGSPVTVYIQKDGAGVTAAGAQTWISLGNVSANGMSTVYIPLNNGDDGSNITLGFRYAIRIVDVNLLVTFKLYEMTIEYDPRPEQVDYLRIQPSNLGTVSRKRIVNYAFVIDTLGNNITFTPYIDNSNAGIAPANSVVATTRKQTYIHYFTQEQIGTDINGILSGGVFEFYGLNDQEIISEKMPVPVKFLVIPAENYGTPNRKRHTSYKFQINTRGDTVSFTPIIDGTSYPSQNFNTTTKQLVEYFFSSSNGDVTGRDIGGILQSIDDITPFEFYGVVTPQQIEQLPDRLLYFVIPVTDYGTPNRKRHTSYKFSINTNGQQVVFTPTLDGITYDPLTFATAGRRTVEYFFNTADGDIIGIDVGGTLAALTSTPFEFYQTVVPQQVETLPPRLEFFRIPNSNFGVAARKRIRTIPIVIDTYGFNVTFTPIVDGVPGLPTTLNTLGKTTTYHFFATDVFGTDFGGTLSDSVNPFEFYELGTPEDVETLPVPKQYDQLGPVRFDRIGKIFNIRIRLITNGTLTAMPLTIYGDNNPSNPTYAGAPLYNTTFPVVPQTDQVYEIQLPKSINTTMARVTIGPFAPSFHRYDMQIRVSQSGMETDAQWIPLR